jgi:putative sugar O-methyltransferase
MRYVKVLSDLVKHDLDDKIVVEIGAGYGGQYVILRQLFKPKKYVFIDLPDTLALIKRYVEKNNLNDIPLEFYDATSLPLIESDLVISNYAYSECRSHIQEIYLKNVIVPAKHGYITYNYHDYQLFINNCSHDTSVVPEQPQTGGNNVIITW